MTLPELFRALGLGADGRGYQSTEVLFAALWLWWVREGTLKGTSAVLGLIGVAIVALACHLRKLVQVRRAEVEARVEVVRLRCGGAADARPGESAADVSEIGS